MPRRVVYRWIALVMVTIALSACGGRGTAAGAVEAYLQALITGDTTRVVNLSCPAWEEQAVTEAASFESVEVSLEGLACRDAGAEGESTLVSCAGKIVAVYDGENQEIDLAGRTYQATLVDGEWKMCGYHR